MKVFHSLGQLTTLMKRVFMDIKVFMTFYLFWLVIASSIYTGIGCNMDNGVDGRYKLINMQSAMFY